MSKKLPGKVQLLRLQANKSRRDQFAQYNSRVSLALQHGVDPALPPSNIIPPVFLFFDWVAFSHKVRQAYYDRLKTDFPGEFIYISASDDFASLQGSISKSGCSVLFDVDAKTVETLTRTEIFQLVGRAVNDFFLQPGVECCFYTQRFSSETGIETSFVDVVIDAVSRDEWDAAQGVGEVVSVPTRPLSGPSTSKSAAAAAVAAATAAASSGASSLTADKHKAAVAISTMDDHNKGLVSVPFYTQRVLKALLRRPVYSEPCTISHVPFQLTVALEGTKCFVFLDSDGTLDEATTMPRSYCCVLDAHVVNICLALAFAEEMEVAEAMAAEARAKESQSKSPETQPFLTTSAEAEAEAKDATESGQYIRAPALEQQLQTTSWCQRIPGLFFLSVDDETKDVTKAVTLRIRHITQLPRDGYKVTRMVTDLHELVTVSTKSIAR